MISDVVDARIEAGELCFVRQLFQGKWNADICAPLGSLQFASLQAGAFRAAEAVETAGEVATFAVQLDAATIRGKPEEPFREAQRSRVAVSLNPYTKLSETAQIAPNNANHTECKSLIPNKHVSVVAYASPVSSA